MDGRTTGYWTSGSRPRRSSGWCGRRRRQDDQNQNCGTFSISSQVESNVVESDDLPLPVGGPGPAQLPTKSFRRYVCFVFSKPLNDLAVKGNGVFLHLFPRQNRISQAEIIMEAKAKNTMIKAKAVQSRPRPFWTRPP